MPNTVVNLVKGQSGVLTIGTEDMGAILNVSVDVQQEALEHVDISDGENMVDLSLPRLTGVVITGNMEEVGDMDKLAMILGAGTATADAFEIDVNDTDYAVDLELTLQGGDMFRYRHTKMRLKAGGGLETGGDWLGLPFELKALKDAAGEFGPMGKLDRYTPS